MKESEGDGWDFITGLILSAVLLAALWCISHCVAK